MRDVAAQWRDLRRRPLARPFVGGERRPAAVRGRGPHRRAQLAGVRASRKRDPDGAAPRRVGRTGRLGSAVEERGTPPWDWSRHVVDHLEIHAGDYEASIRFYATVLAPLGIPSWSEDSE